MRLAVSAACSELCQCYTLLQPCRFRIQAHCSSAGGDELGTSSANGASEAEGLSDLDVASSPEVVLAVNSSAGRAKKLPLVSFCSSIAVVVTAGLWRHLLATGKLPLGAEPCPGPVCTVCLSARLSAYTEWAAATVLTW